MSGLYDKDKMIVPIAIREDLVARLQIPADLTLAEAKKIARVVLAYASGMEAPSGGETENTGSTEGDSPVAESETPNLYDSRSNNPCP